jgi:hypothetical protein
VAGGGALIDPSITRRLIQQFVRASRPSREEPSQLAAGVLVRARRSSV